MARFFIDRPIFAWVIAIFISLVGLLALQGLPVAQYPNVAPPSISISASYPGASAQTMDETVVSIIEQEVNGAEGLIYMRSLSQINGTAELQMTFSPETDPDMAQVDIQNRLARAASRLPAAVNQQGIKVEKANANVLMIVTLSSNDPSMSRFAIGDYVVRNILPVIQRTPGVGQVRLFGSERAMRIWLDMDRLAALNLAPEDIENAVRSQNAQVSSGMIGALPSVEGQRVSATLVVEGQLTSPESFGDIVIKSNADGSNVYLRDVAEIVLGGQMYDISAQEKNNQVVGLGIQPMPNSNAIETANEVRKRLDELAPYFPPGMSYGVPNDASQFIKVSIDKVFMTLIEAMLLVFIVMFFFLQGVRYTLIPAIVVPVSLLGTCALLFAFGLSINVLTMFAMVLAIGILVDDAIVVVENVERLMAEEGLSPREATIKAMRQITGAIIGITVVLVSVFIPMSFFGGSVGNIYRQFSLTMVVAILFSVFLALSLTPALCATLLRPVDHSQTQKGLFGWFNRLLTGGTSRYNGMLGRMLGRSGRFMLVYGVLVALAAFLLLRLPTGFLPTEDQGRIFAITQLPPGATNERAVDVANQIEEYFYQQPEVERVISIVGTNFFGAGQNMVNTFVAFKHWDERQGENQSATAIAGRAMQGLMAVRDAHSVVINPPPIPELGNGVGFSVRLQDRAGLGHDALRDARDQLQAAADAHPAIQSFYVEGVEDAPLLHLDIDRDRAYSLKVNFADVNEVLSSALGSRYINDFPNRGRMQRVVVQAQVQHRMQAEQLLALQVRNADGEMVPLSAFASTRWERGPIQLVRYNSYPAYRISGTPAPGYSTGEAMIAIEELIADLPAGIGYEWSGTSREERISGSQMPLLMGLSILSVFLCLAALYESWTTPLAVIMVVPLGMLGSLLAVTVLGMPNDVYFKVGLITIIGLSAKNAILIIEFARNLLAQGDDLVTATRKAAVQRLRPILMTSFAFILGVLPLAKATGAGAAGQQAIGIGVMGGMFSATVLAILLVPIFFVVVNRVFVSKKKTEE